MFKGFDPHKPYFHSVSLALIVTGAGIFAVGLVEWLLNYFDFYYFHAPFSKIVAGLIIAALGYIHLELELIRISRK
jgi:hypothetical protein